MSKHLKYISYVFLAAFILSGTFTANALNICAICGKEIEGPIYDMTDKVTGQKVLVCSTCMTTLPRCFICGLPIKKGDELALPDGRYFCKRDSANLVLKTEDVQQVCAEVKNGLDRLFSRFTSFPNNVEVSAIDMVDTEYIFTRETPELLGLTKPITDDNGHRHYEIRLVTGLPRAELQETCAHEYSHTWVGENVPAERHHRIASDAEEGFCEMVGYLYVDSIGDEGQKKRVLANNYTRGQVALFLQAEQQYGFDDVLDWMRYGVTSRLEAGHLDEIRDIKIPSAAKTISQNFSAAANKPVATAVAAPVVIKLEGVLWGNSPSVIINGKSFFVGDSGSIKIGGTNLPIRCLMIQKNFARIQNLSNSKEINLQLPGD